MCPCMRNGISWTMHPRSSSVRRYTGCLKSTGEQVKKARLIANPGFPHLFLPVGLPAGEGGLIDPNTLIIDAKSGTSGAGRGAKVDSLYCEVNENIKAYGWASTDTRRRLRNSCPMRQESL